MENSRIYIKDICRSVKIPAGIAVKPPVGANTDVWHLRSEYIILYFEDLLLFLRETKFNNRTNWFPNISICMVNL